MALVIGNGAYKSVPALSNPPNDAGDIAAALQRLGFAVTLITNAGFDEMRRGLIAFGRNAAGADMAAVYFAGHGMEINGDNWLIPVDAELKRDTDAANEAISLQSVMLQVANTASLGLVILDACRNNPFAAKMSRSLATRAAAGSGLGRIEPVGNMLVAYAARDGTIALDGDGRNSPFAAALLHNIETPGVEVLHVPQRPRRCDGGDAQRAAAVCVRLAVTQGDLSRGRAAGRRRRHETSERCAGSRRIVSAIGDSSRRDRSRAGRHLGDHGAGWPRPVALDLEDHGRRHLSIPRRALPRRAPARRHRQLRQRPLDAACAERTEELQRRRLLRGPRHHCRDHRQARHRLLEAQWGVSGRGATVQPEASPSHKSSSPVAG
ncbi:caspase family protein [Bradyrhizobium sp. Arg62]|nr:caspase family protein [Bradyrhizobium brasilense]